MKSIRCRTYDVPMSIMAARRAKHFKPLKKPAKAHVTATTADAIMRGRLAAMKATQAMAVMTKLNDINASFWGRK